MATTWAEQVPFLGPAPLTLAQTVEKMSNGRLKIKVDSPNKHKAPFGVMDMVKKGQYDLAYTASYYYKGKDYKLVFFTTVPFGMLLSEQYAWYNYGGGKELAAKVYSEHGLISYPMGSTGMQMGGWFKKEIKILDDLKGLKFRIPGQGGEVMAKLGVNAVNTPPGELYTSLERNTIDAVESGLVPFLTLRWAFINWQITIIPAGKNRQARFNSLPIKENRRPPRRLTCYLRIGYQIGRFPTYGSSNPCQCRSMGQYC